MIDGRAGVQFKSEVGAAGLISAFSTRLRDWRAAKRIPLKQIASDLGVSISVVSAWERGTRFPSVVHLQQVADYSGIPVCQLLRPIGLDCPRRSDGG